jgi:hypothetical protein
LPFSARIFFNYIKGSTAKKQRNYSKNEAKKIKSYNFTRSNKEKSIIAIAILEK